VPIVDFIRPLIDSKGPLLDFKGPLVNFKASLLDFRPPLLHFSGPLLDSIAPHVHSARLLRSTKRPNACSTGSLLFSRALLDATIVPAVPNNRCSSTP
jgi:hypothetical protein